MTDEPWQGWSIRVAHVQVYDKEDDRGCEGMVLYELSHPCPPDCPAVEGDVQGNLDRLHWSHSDPAERSFGGKADPWHTEYRYLSQPFHSGGQRHYKGATAEQIADNQANIWAWDGNRTEPTLTPSYYFLGRQDPKNRYPDWPAIHIFLTKGKIVDSGCDARILQ